MTRAHVPRQNLDTAIAILKLLHRNIRCLVPTAGINWRPAFRVPPVHRDTIRPFADIEVIRSSALFSYCMEGCMESCMRV